MTIPSTMMRSMLEMMDDLFQFSLHHGSTLWWREKSQEIGFEVTATATALQEKENIENPFDIIYINLSFLHSQNGSNRIGGK